jgi:methionyl-tRNA formyltransferase
LRGVVETTLALCARRKERYKALVARILLFGQAPFGAKVMEGLRERGHEILAACVPPDREGKPLDPLKEAAIAAGVPVIQRKSYKTPDAIAEVRPERADVGVLAYVTQIIPRAILDAPRLASICFHPSLLPKYRGGAAINWQLIRGETLSGVTLFRPDDGVDTGPIYLQREIAVGPDDTSGSFYYAKVFEPGVAATLECVELLLSGKARGVVQDEALATSDPLCRDEHAAIDWSKPVTEVHNLVRGCDPSPGAHVSFGGKTVRFFGSRIASTTPSAAAPGTVVAIGADGIEVAARGGSLRFAKLSAGGGKVAASEAASQIGLSVGAQL